MKKLAGMMVVLVASMIVGCAGPASNSPAMASNSAPQVRAEQKAAVEKACEGKGGDCVTAGLSDLAKRGYNFTADTASKTYNDEGNQKAVKDGWQWIKDQAGKGYDAAKDAIQD